MNYADPEVTEKVCRAIADALAEPTDEKIRAINVAVFQHDRAFPESFVTHYTKPILDFCARAIRFKTWPRRIEELRLADDRAYRLPMAVRDALRQRTPSQQ